MIKIYTNVDRLQNKIDEITLFLDKHDIDVMAVCEVLPKSKNQCISSFVIEGYDCYSCLQGRGVCVFVKSKLNITIIELDEFECVFKPSVFIKIILLVHLSYCKYKVIFYEKIFVVWYLIFIAGITRV